MQAKLWDASTHVDRSALPSLGRMIADLSESRIEATAYDAGIYERLKASLY